MSMPAALRHDGWRECPAVTGGGKAVFYFRRDPLTDRRQWIVWDRYASAWTFQEDDVARVTIET